MRFLLGANAFKLKNNRNKELLADKKAVWPPQPLPEQKSPFREWNRRIPFLALNKNCSGPSLLFWNILLTRPIKTTAAKHTHIHTHTEKSPSPPTPSTAPARQRWCKPTSPSFNFVFWPGRGHEPCRHKQTPAERRWKPAAMLALFSTMHTFRGDWHRRALACEPSA